MIGSSVFSREISQIENNEIVAMLEIVFNSAPPQFWTKPASSTSKYHPDSSNVNGGLVIHTKQVFYIAKAILDAKMDLLLADRDIVLASCLLHDIYKYDFSASQYTVRNHGIGGVEFISNLKPLREFLMSTYKNPPSWYLEILKCVKSHNGKFTKEHTGFFDEAQTIVHLADWIACQRWCYFDLTKLK